MARKELFVQAGLVFEGCDIQLLILSGRKRNLFIQGLGCCRFAGLPLLANWGASSVFKERKRVC
jgi:hypothetical protein